MLTLHSKSKSCKDEVLLVINIQRFSPRYIIIVGGRIYNVSSEINSDPTWMKKKK